MALPLKYNIRNVVVRWRATIATVLGIALVVAVFILVQSLAIGLEKSSANTGDERNVLVVRKGSTSESSSLISREQLKAIQYAPEIARDERGEPMISGDVFILMNLPRKGGEGGEANVLLRGVSPRGMQLRPQVSLIGGPMVDGVPLSESEFAHRAAVDPSLSNRMVHSRWFVPGKREVVVSRRLASRFANFGVGDSFKTGPTVLTVVGWMDGQGSAYDAEVWMDADEARGIFDRENYSSLLIRPVDAAARSNLVNRVEGDKRLQLRAYGEVEYYKTQTATAQPIKWLGGFLATAMSIGAVCAAMNTMYASVGARTREIGTLRVLGYRRQAILLSFLIEGALLALIGGALGCLFALPMNGYATGTINFQTFSETVFEFTITPALILKGMIFSVCVGILGSLFPALRASRLPPIEALKSV